MKKIILTLLFALFLIGSVSAFDWQDSMLTYYQFDEAADGTPLAVIDATGHQNATNIGASNTSGILNSAYNFDSDYITIADNSSLENTDTFSIQAWINPDTLAASPVNLVDKGDAVSSFNLRWQDVTSLYFCVDNQCAGDLSFTTTGSWSHIVMTYDKVTVRLYINGNNIANTSDATGLTQDGNNITIGAIWSGDSNFFDGTIDEVGFWNKTLGLDSVRELYNGGSGLAFVGEPPIEPPAVTLNSPANDFETINRTITFNVTVTDDVGVGNVSLFIDGVLNQTNTSGFNGTYIFTSILEYDSHNWSVGAIDVNNSGTNSSTRNFTIDYYSLNSQTYNTTTAETFTESFIADISIASGVSLTSATLVYNGTSYVGSITSSGNNRSLSRTIIIPNVTATVNVTFYWDLTLNNGTSFFRNTTSTNQTVNSLSIDNCAINPIMILNYTVYDEDDRFLLANTTNITANIFVRLSGDFTGEVFEYFAGNTSGNNMTICVESALVSGQNYRLDSTIQYTAGDYVTEYHYIEDFRLNLSTSPQNVSLYLLLATRSQEFLITFKDINFIPLEDAIIELTREYLSLGQFLTVEIMKTDKDGRTIGHFVLNDEIYTILVKKDGELRATFENVRAFCSDISTGDCRINLNEAGSTTNPSSFENSLDVIGLQTYDDTTKEYTFTFSTVDSSTKTIEVNITKFDNYLNDTICFESLASSSGSITCTIGEEYYNNSAYVEIFVNGELWGSSIFEITISKSAILTASRFLLAFFLIITIPLIAFTSGPMTIVLFIVGLVMAGLLALIDWGGFIGPFSAFLWFIVAAIVILFKAAGSKT